MPTGTAYAAPPTVAEGMMRNDTSQSSLSSASTMQHYTGNNEWRNFVNIADTITTHFLVVAGGGSGATFHGGGGGAGGYRTSYGTESPITLSGGSMESTVSLSKSVAYTVTVGDGAAGVTSTTGANLSGNNGSDSTFSGSFTGSPITSTGGGAGSSYNTQTTPGTGGSGGGASPGTAGSGNTPPVSPPQGNNGCLLYTSPSPRDRTRSRMPSSA